MPNFLIINNKGFVINNKHCNITSLYKVYNTIKQRCINIIFNYTKRCLAGLKDLFVSCENKLIIVDISRKIRKIEKTFSESIIRYANQICLDLAFKFEYAFKFWGNT